MSFLRALIAVSGLSILIGGAAFSADLPTDRPVTLRECIEFALANHSSVRSAGRELDASRAEVRSARAGYLPRLEASSDYFSSGRSGTSSSRFGVRDTSASGVQEVIRLTETVFDGFRTPTAIRQAWSSARASEADLELARQERMLAVTTAYLNLLRAGRLADIAARTVEQSEEQKRLIQGRIDAGDAAPIDIYPVDVQLANAKLEKIRADNDVRVAANALRNAIGLDRGPALCPVDVGAPSTELPQLQECVESALEDRPEIMRSISQIESQKATAALARLVRLPQPTASASYQRGFADAGFDKQWEIGIGLSLNVFDGGAAAADERSAKARLDALLLRDEQLRKDIATEVEEAYLNLINALERLEASKSNVMLAQKNLEVAKAKYQEGLGIPIEITTAEVAYADAQTQNAEALYDSYVARAQLEKAMGRRSYSLWQ